MRPSESSQDPSVYDAVLASVFWKRFGFSRVSSPLYRPVNGASKFGLDVKSFTEFETQSPPFLEPFPGIS